MAKASESTPGANEERRKELRKLCQFALRFRRLATPRLWEVDDRFSLEGVAVNISPSGLCLETDCYIVPGQLLEIDLRPNGGSLFIGKLQAVRIVRVTGTGVVFEFQVGMVGEADSLQSVYEDLE